MKRVGIFDFDDEEQESVNQIKLILLSADEARDEWLHRRKIEGFLRGVLPRMNPFLAMRVFAFEPRVSAVLATDQTPEGQAFWSTMVEQVFPNKKRIIRPGAAARPEPLLQRLTNIRNVVEDEQVYKELELIHRLAYDNKFALRNNNQRHWFMWHWMTFRVLTRERVRVDREAEEAIKSTLPTLMKMRLAEVDTVVPGNAEVQVPGQVNMVDRTGKILTSTLLFQTFPGAAAAFQKLTPASKYIVYQVCGPVIDLLHYQGICTIIATMGLDIIAAFARRAAQTGSSVAKLLLQNQRQHALVEPYSLNHGNTWIHTYVSNIMDRISTTYPSNPDAGPGIFTGGAVCISCNSSNAVATCGGPCEQVLYCGQECANKHFSEHKHECKK